METFTVQLTVRNVVNQQHLDEIVNTINDLAYVSDIKRDSMTDTGIA